MPDAPGTVRVRRALLSVSDKTGIGELAGALERAGCEILSTGGTAGALREAGVGVTDVAAHTGAPEILDGRVKTLHPKVHGGLLGRRGDAGHAAEMEEHGIGGIDLLCVNLYPFEATVAKGADEATCVENIDIGGPAMIRSAAKNHEGVVVLVDPDDYAGVIGEIGAGGGVSRETRRRLAAKAFARTAAYDSAVAAWFRGNGDGGFGPWFSAGGTRVAELRYGENPHQRAALYATGAGGIAGARQLQGKELSYNNLNDADAAWALVSEIGEPACAIIKHANPSGVARAADLAGAYRLALRCDPVSAFGGIVAFNRPLDADAARAVAELFVEVVVAPEVTEEARAAFRAKRNLRVLEAGSPPAADGGEVRMVAGGFLVQSRDGALVDADGLEVVTKRKPDAREVEDLVFAFRVCKHVKSNAIVYVRDGATVAVGAGQMSRVDSARIAADKARAAAREAGLERPLTEGSVVASDAFFPFADGLLAAVDAGATAVVQPGGSVRDGEVIAAADERGIAMAFTGVRHFRH